jgi:hypothetical protein
VDEPLQRTEVGSSQSGFNDETAARGAKILRPSHDSLTRQPSARPARSTILIPCTCDTGMTTSEWRTIWTKYLRPSKYGQVVRLFRKGAASRISLD